MQYSFVVAQNLFYVLQPDVAASWGFFKNFAKKFILAIIQYIVTRVHWLNYLEGYYT